MTRDSSKDSIEAGPHPEPSRPSRVLEICAALLPILLALALFWPIRSFSFVNVDDDRNIFQNPHIFPIATQNLSWFWSHGWYNLYMPVTFTLWGWLARFDPIGGVGLDVPGSGLSVVNPIPFHTASLILHLANIALAYVLLRRCGFRPVASAAGVLLFAIHPVQVEAVAWVTGMNNLTGGFFTLLALVLYVEAGRNDTPAGKNRQATFAVLATLAYVLALMSKPTASATPFLALALEWGVLRRPVKRWLPLIGIWLALAATCAIITHFTSSYATGRVHSPIWARPFVAGDSLAWAITQTIFPYRDTIVYRHSITVVLGSWWGYVTWLLPAIVAILLWRVRKSARELCLGALFLTAALLPVLGLIPFYSQEFTTVADRFLYIALIGPGIAIAWLLTRWDYRPVVAAPILMACLALGARSVVYLPSWHDTFALATNTIRVNPTDARSQMNYGIYLAEHGYLREALTHFETAASLKPNEAAMQYHVGVTEADIGDLDAAIPPLQRAVSLEPKMAEAWFRLGVALARAHRSGAAEAALRERLKLVPSDGQTHYILGVVLANANRPAEALPEMEATVRFVPMFPDGHFSLGKLLDRLGRHDEARQQYQETLRLDSSNSAARAALSASGTPASAAKPASGTTTQ